MYAVDASTATALDAPRSSSPSARTPMPAPTSSTVPPEAPDSAMPSSSIRVVGRGPLRR